jgi:hypothetical protein
MVHQKRVFWHVYVRVCLTMCVCNNYISCAA